MISVDLAVGEEEIFLAAELLTEGEDVGVEGGGDGFGIFLIVEEEDEIAVVAEVADDGVVRFLAEAGDGEMLEINHSRKGCRQDLSRVSVEPSLCH